jgi:hypothetical protein
VRVGVKKTSHRHGSPDPIQYAPSPRSLLEHVIEEVPSLLRASPMRSGSSPRHFSFSQRARRVSHLRVPRQRQSGRLYAAHWACFARARAAIMLRPHPIDKSVVAFGFPAPVKSPNPSSLLPACINGCRRPPSEHSAEDPAPRAD